MTSGLRRSLPGLKYDSVNSDWEMADFEHCPHGWPHARRFCVARRFIPNDDTETTLFSLGRHVYRVWVTNMNLTPSGIWHFYDGRAAMEPRIGELRENFALRKIPSRSFAANALYLEIIRLAYNLVTAFQRTCLQVQADANRHAPGRPPNVWLAGNTIGASKLSEPRQRRLDVAVWFGLLRTIDRSKSLAIVVLLRPR